MIAHDGSVADTRHAGVQVRILSRHFPTER
jgi:hypothetical protein